MSRLVGLSYWISGKLYLSLTNQCNAVPIHILRGPSFSLPQCPPLLHEPSPEDIAHAVDEAFEANKINVCDSILCLLRYVVVGRYCTFYCCFLRTVEGGKEAAVCGPPISRIPLHKLSIFHLLRSIEHAGECTYCI